MKKETVRRWIIQYIAVFLLPLMAVIGMLFSYMIKSMSNSSISLLEKTMELFVNQLEENLGSMERILLTVYDNNMDLSYLCVSEDRNQLNMSKIAYSNFLGRQALVADRFDGLFTIVQREDELIYIDAGKQGKDKVKEEIARLAEADGLKELAASHAWFAHEIEGEGYLMRITQNGKSYCGAWICLKPMAGFLQQYSNFKETEVAVCDIRGNTVSQTSEKGGSLARKCMQDSQPARNRLRHTSYVIGRAESPYAHLQFLLFVPARAILLEVHILEGIACLVFALVLALVYLFWRRMKVKIIVPCTRLGEAMEQVESEKPLLLTSEPLYEFGQIQQGFNEMKVQIRNLKIQGYEQKIREQNIHMQYLFSQIQPHFFLNALNVIYSFAEIERYDLIQKMVMAMVRYLRYVFNNGSKPVALKDELSHVEDFITIQQIRYPDRIVYEKEIDPGTEETGILPFLLQTFVENCIKYGLKEDGINRICISVKKAEGRIVITVSDTGKGFTEEELCSINSRDENSDTVQKLGIRNTRQRLKLAYGDSAEITAENGKQGGAVVRISFPDGEQGKE